MLFSYLLLLPSKEQVQHKLNMFLVGRIYRLPYLKLCTVPDMPLPETSKKAVDKFVNNLSNKQTDTQAQKPVTNTPTCSETSVSMQLTNRASETNLSTHLTDIHS